ncbi:MAG: substrate-binding domain-containing protein, partial [Janthinobacterium lividum]
MSSPLSAVGLLSRSSPGSSPGSSLRSRLFAITARVAPACAALAALAVLAVSSNACAAGLSGAPAPFDKGHVDVALVSLFSDGDFFQVYQAGAEKQANALGIRLRRFPGRGDSARQRDAIEQAINLGVKGLIIDHGMPDTIRDVAQKAVDAGIKVVA